VTGPSAGHPCGFDLERDAPVRSDVRMATQPPNQIGAEIAAQEAGHPEAAPLLHVDGFVPGELFVTGPPGTNAHDRSERDRGRARRHGPADHAPVVGRSLDVHSDSLDVHSEKLSRELLAPIRRARVLWTEQLEEIDELLARVLVGLHLR
jgi:hypothetical protein